MTASKRVAQGYLLIQIATYVTKIFTAFGLIGRRNGDDWLLNLDTETASHGIGYRSAGAGSNREATMRPVLQALSDFRKQVRYVLDVLSLSLSLSLATQKSFILKTLQGDGIKVRGR